MAPGKLHHSTGWEASRNFIELCERMMYRSLSNDSTGWQTLLASKSENAGVASGLTDLGLRPPLNSKHSGRENAVCEGQIRLGCVSTSPHR